MAAKRLAKIARAARWRARWMVRALNGSLNVVYAAALPGSRRGEVLSRSFPPRGRLGLAPAAPWIPTTADAHIVIARAVCVAGAVSMLRLTVHTFIARSQVDLEIAIGLDADAGAVGYWHHPFVHVTLECAAGSHARSYRPRLEVADPPADGRGIQINVPRPIDLDIDVDGCGLDAWIRQIAAKPEV